MFFLFCWYCLDNISIVDPMPVVSCWLLHLCIWPDIVFAVRGWKICQHHGKQHVHGLFKRDVCIIGSINGMSNMRHIVWTGNVHIQILHYHDRYNMPIMSNWHVF